MPSSNVRHLTPNPPSASPATKSPQVQADPLRIKRGEIGYRNSSLSTSRSSDQAEVEDVPTAEDLEDRVNSRNGPCSRSSPASGTRQGMRSLGQSIVNSLPRLPQQNANPSTLNVTISPPIPLSDDQAALKKNQEKRRKLIVAIIILSFGCVFLVGTILGYVLALERDRRVMKHNSQDPIINGDGDQDGTKSSAPFIHSLFGLAILFELIFIHRRARDIYIIRNYAIESDVPEKSSLRGKFKKFAEWFLRIPETKLRPPPEALPSYLHALDMPGGTREGLGNLTREQRRQRRIGVSRGTGDVEDIEVERAWRMGGGKGLPLYEGDDMKASTVLLSGPPLQPPTSPLSRRISVRITQGAELLARLSRRISGLRSPTQTNNTADTSNGLRPPPSPGGPKSPRSLRSVPSTPIRAAYHASVVLDLAACEDEKDSDFVTSESPSQSPDEPPSSLRPLSALSFSSAVPPSPTAPKVAHHRKRNSIVRYSNVRQPSVLYSLQEGDNESNTSH